ncbi:hypothetical protein RF679_05000 [Undibacterium cyanobacteriorum]|uniref:Methyltransferase type 11 domain-containing protein n=1 Tax=Undibacterium cyanobacteriorum TaxID=3073561 RepID=A0ABY9RK99_9BURK|nr:hypothetical protein [Undibacterium sp. 20NA77.5]WMW81638.1 hypothetical protein RF679_05000 [Undibacterium sp. 20NA77.5]
MFSLFKSKSDTPSNSATTIKLNLGCGFNKLPGFVNVDKFDACAPDVVVDLEVLPWPFADNSVSEVLLSHVLEHLGASVDVFQGIIQELYRVCCHDAVIKIYVPHPRSDNFINDPTHVRIITPSLLGLLDMENCELWEREGASNTALAKYWKVNFKLVDTKIVPEPKYLAALESGRLSQAEFLEMAETRNNIVTEYQMTLRVVK